MDSFAFASFSFAVLGALVSLIVFIIDAIRKKDVKELKDKFDKVKKVTIQNTYDVAYLKATK